MSSKSNLIVSLTLIQTNLYKFGGPILMTIGTVSCILSLAVFTKKHLRKNPCSVCFVAYNIGSFLLIYTSLLFTTLLNGYNITPSSYNLSFCHFRNYMMTVLDVLNPFYIILASVDRILLTSPNALTRQRSTRRLAYVSVISVTLFWLLVHIHTLFLTNIIQPAPNFVVCYFEPGMYFALISYYTTIVKGILVPLCMIIFGVWTVKNIRHVGRVAPVLSVTRSRTGVGVCFTHSKDRQLIRIVLIDISIYIIFSLMLSAVFMYQQFNQSQSQSIVDAKTQSFLLSVAVFSGYIPYCVGCYTNLMVSKRFRHEIEKVIMCK
jgi:hypothetical protein